MSEWTESDRRIGMWSAASAAGIGVVYAIVGIIGVMERPPGGDAFRQVDPYLAILEILIILFVVALVTMMSAVYAYAAAGRKTYALAALAFTVAWAILTCSTHFVGLTVGRQIEAAAMPQLSQQLSFEGWPTIALALDLLGWDFFLGLSLLFASAVFKGGGRKQARVRAGMILGGTLCLAGTLGPLLGRMRLQVLGIAGYAFVLPAVCALLAVLFAREQGKG
jgi:hypothetical protein